jgi:hypothetical protein
LLSAPSLRMRSARERVLPQYVTRPLNEIVTDAACFT